MGVGVLALGGGILALGVSVITLARAVRGTQTTAAPSPSVRPVAHDRTRAQDANLGPPRDPSPTMDPIQSPQDGLGVQSLRDMDEDEDQIVTTVLRADQYADIEDMLAALEEEARGAADPGPGGRARGPGVA